MRSPGGGPVAGGLAPMTGYLHAMRAARHMQDIPPKFLERLPKDMRDGRLSQAKMAIMTRVNERHYRAFENRAERNIFSVNLAHDVADILGASPDQRVALVIWAKPGKPRVLQPPVIDVALRGSLNAQLHPAFIVREDFAILACNEPAVRAFPWMADPGANFVLWSLGEGTGSADILLNWAEDWADPLIARLRLAQVRYHDNPCLMRVIDTIKKNPSVRRIWDRDCSMKSSSFGDIRVMRLPRIGRTRVQVTTYQPTHNEDTLMVVLTPLVD